MRIGRIVDHQIQLNVEFQTFQSEVDEYIKQNLTNQNLDDEESCRVLSALIHLRNSIQYALKELRECKQEEK